MNKRHAHAELIEKVGAAEVKDAYALSRQNLHAWRRRGVPHLYRVSFAKMAAMRGVAIPEDFFAGMK